MSDPPTPALGKEHSLRALQASIFFLADVQTGLGPFLAAYLAAAGWNPGRVGLALTLGGVITVALQTPAGAFVDRVHSKRLVLVVGSLVLAVGALLLSFTADRWAVYSSQVLIGGAGPLHRCDAGGDHVLCRVDWAMGKCAWQEAAAVTRFRCPAGAGASLHGHPPPRRPRCGAGPRRHCERDFWRRIGAGRGGQDRWDRTV